MFGHPLLTAPRELIHARSLSSSPSALRVPLRLLRLRLLTLADVLRAGQPHQVRELVTTVVEQRDRVETPERPGDDGDLADGAVATQPVDDRLSARVLR